MATIPKGTRLQEGIAAANKFGKGGTKQFFIETKFDQLTFESFFSNGSSLK